MTVVDEDSDVSLRGGKYKRGGERTDWLRALRLARRRPMRERFDLDHTAESPLRRSSRAKPVEEAESQICFAARDQYTHENEVRRFPGVVGPVLDRERTPRCPSLATLDVALRQQQSGSLRGCRIHEVYDATLGTIREASSMVSSAP